LLFMRYGAEEMTSLKEMITERMYGGSHEDKAHQ